MKRAELPYIIAIAAMLALVATWSWGASQEAQRERLERRMKHVLHVYGTDANHPAYRAAHYIEGGESFPILPNPKLAGVALYEAADAIRSLSSVHEDVEIRRLGERVAVSTEAVAKNFKATP